MKLLSLERERGFSLVEVLVALSIMAILAGVVFSVIQEGRKKARDTQRQSDLQQLQIATRTYRDSFSTATLPAVSAGEIIGDGVGFDIVLAPYLVGIIKDPMDGITGFGYYYDSDHVCNGSSRSVVVALTMEQPYASNYGKICGGIATSTVMAGITPSETAYIVILK